MTYDQQTGTKDIRKEVIDKAIKQVTKHSYKFKQALNIVSGSAWKHSFFREKTNVLTGESGNATKGIPRGVEFPQATVEWEKISNVIEKYGLEETILFEDIISSEIAVKDRTIIKLAEGVAKSVDDENWNILTEGLSPSNIQSITIGSGKEWDSSGADIIDDIEHGTQLLSEANYPIDKVLMFINAKDKRSIIKYLTDKGAQFNSVAEEAARNGVIGKLGSVTFVVSNSVTADYALMVIPKRCGNWQELLPLSTDINERKFKDTTVTTCEMGVTELTDPLAVILYSNTQK